MEEHKDKGQWGGKRSGAGRPTTHSKLYSLRLPEDLAKIVDAQVSKTDYIKECIVKAQPRQEEENAEKPERVIPFGKVYHATEVSDVRLPFFDIGIVAGFPIPLDNDERAEDVELIKLLCPNPEASYLIRVQGNSMIDAGIHSGDVVIVDKSNRSPSENEVAVCEYNGEYTLKHFRRHDGYGWLVPANPDYPEIRITPEDDFCIWGTVTYVIHKPQA